MLSFVCGIHHLTEIVEYLFEVLMEKSVDYNKDIRGAFHIVLLIASRDNLVSIE